MKSVSEKLTGLLTLLCFASFGALRAAAQTPTEWVDPTTKHSIIQLSQEPGSSSFYFHQNGYTASGKLVISTPEGLSTINLQTHKIEPLVEGHSGGEVVDKKAATSTTSR